MKHNLQSERILFELNKGNHVIFSDDENRYDILFSATEAINENTLNFHKNFSKSFPNILLSPERCKTLNIKTDYCCSITVNSEWTKNQIYDLAFGNNVNTNLKLNGVIEEKSKLMNLSLEILKKGKLLPSGIFSIINNPLHIEIEQLAIKNSVLLLLKKNPQDIKRIISFYLSNIKNKFDVYFDDNQYFKLIKIYFNHDVTNYNFLGFSNINMHDGIISFFKEKNLIKIS